MNVFHDEEDEHPLGVMPSAFVSRDEIQSALRGIRRILWGLLVLLVINGAAVILMSGKRSEIVALSSDGHMQVLSPVSDLVYRKNLSQIVRYFASDFLSNLTAYDSFEISYHLERALEVMTPEFRARMKREILTQNILESVKKAGIHTVMTIKGLTMHQVMRGVWSVNINGERRTYAFGQKGSRTQDFSATLLIRHGGSTAFNPYGMWVENYREEISHSTVLGQ